MRNDSSLTLSTAEENYIKGLRLEGKTSFPMLKPKERSGILISTTFSM